MASASGVCIHVLSETIQTACVIKASAVMVCAKEQAAKRTKHYVTQEHWYSLDKIGFCCTRNWFFFCLFSLNGCVGIEKPPERKQTVLGISKNPFFSNCVIYFKKAIFFWRAAAVFIHFADVFLLWETSEK